MKKRTRIILAVVIASITFGTLHATVGKKGMHNCESGWHDAHNNFEETAPQTN